MNDAFERHIKPVCVN